MNEIGGFLKWLFHYSNLRINLNGVQHKDTKGFFVIDAFLRHSENQRFFDSDEVKLCALNIPVF